MTHSLLTEADMAAIIGGYHKNPFSVLGAHPTDDNTTLVRVFEPNAVAIVVKPLDGNLASAEMTRRHRMGLFEGEFSGELGLYQLVIQYDNNTALTKYDPYAFASTLSEHDRYLLAEGTDQRAYNKLGAHLIEINGVPGTRFLVWAPNAERVSVVGRFNHWDGRHHPMNFHAGGGLWELFIPELGVGELYKYEIKSRTDNYIVQKSDPVGFFHEVRPNNASIIWDIEQYQWGDAAWLSNRLENSRFNRPMSVYEVHLGSWQRKGDNEWLTYRELAERLIPYVVELGYTHIELLPITEYPYDGSWGYQVTGYFAPTSRFGTPDEFMYFVDQCHQNNLGVILDWVPAHFPKDAHGLGYFDGTHLYEHADPRQGEHPDWGTYIFNYDRNEVRQFLISNALFWADKYHLDGLRVDAVASMLYLDFSRPSNQWIPNTHGGRENLGAIQFLRDFNDQLHAQFPDVLTIAEESTDWAGVTKPTAEQGLGFDMKWNMGWMHDTLQYLSTDPIFRTYHHGTLTFSLLYAFSERFMLPLSHDEVVHLKKSLLDKMPGDGWQKFANLRLLYGYMWVHPGKKLLFMGGEFGQGIEWTEKYSLDWHLVYDGSPHERLSHWVRDLNYFYRQNSALYAKDDAWDGFDWLEVHDSAHSVLAFVRQDQTAQDSVIVVCNFTPVVRHGYRLGVPTAGVYKEMLNSDNGAYGGSNVTNDFLMATDAGAWRGHPHSLQLTLPPLGIVIIKQVDSAAQSASL